MITASTKGLTVTNESAKESSLQNGLSLGVNDGVGLFLGKQSGVQFTVDASDGLELQVTNAESAWNATTTKLDDAAVPVQI